jgi:plastocyanin
VAFFEGKDSSAPRILPQADTPLFPGPQKATYKLPALKAGSYFFHCDAHSGMTGELNVRTR